jgi:hypothetical protein
LPTAARRASFVQIDSAAEQRHIPQACALDIPQPDPNQIDGYLVVLKPGPTFGAWKTYAERTAGAESVAAHSAALRTALPTIDPSRYRGFQRDAIDRSWDGDPSAGERAPNYRARCRIRDLYGPDPCLRWSQPPWFDPDLLPSIEVAREFLSLTDAPSDRELLRVTRINVEPTPNTLGFDVGYWGSDHFSLIADAMILPRWHSCPPEQLGSLEPWARILNDNMLFRTAAEAMDYRRWYLCQGWAEQESEPGEFQIIRADLAP